MPDASIIAATIKRCLDEQYLAAQCHRHSKLWFDYDTLSSMLLKRAVREQLLSAYHAEQARLRLFQLV